MDDNGYPEEDELAVIREWDAMDLRGLMKYVETLWTYRGEYFKQVGDVWYISTGGWSGNEDIVGAMQDNYIWWALNWLQTRRGGHYIFCTMQTSIEQEIK